ncbi:MAG: methyltransferase domain-containing protein [Chloroflexi bacterium]|nr:methyltransferase domain-containing protein [Chloroflexota bacterium]
MPWNPDLYHKFQTARAAPFEDLCALLSVREGLHVVDLGCGTGELTARLADKLPGSSVVGIDSSPQMLARAAPLARMGLRFEQGTIEDFVENTADGTWDVLFSHAALHWVEDHPRLLPRLLRKVRAGGQIAVQMPSNHEHIAHQLLRQVAREEPFASALGGYVRLSPVLGIDSYATLLFRAGCGEITVYEKVYPQVLANAQEIVEFTRSTALLPYLERLDAETAEAFLRMYTERLREKMPEEPVFYSFQRILFAAAL